MAFRRSEDEPAAQGLQRDPWPRFVALHDAFDQDRGMWGDRAPLRFAAVTMLAMPGTAEDVAARVRAEDKAIADELGWLSDIGSSIRLLIAGLLVKQGDTAHGFLEEVERVSTMFRKAKVRRARIYETIAILVMRQRTGNQPLTMEHVERFKAIYDELKRYHWFLTGADDFPACAILVGQPGEPEVIGRQIEDVYQALRTRAKLWRGDPLQTAANVLYLSGLEADEIADRFARLAAGFKAAGVRVGQAEYDELAVLCFLARPLEAIVDSVVGMRDRIRKDLEGVDKSMAFSLGTSIAFVQLVAGHADLGPLADAKMLLDMQAILAARQAAMAAAAATGATSA